MASFQSRSSSAPRSSSSLPLCFGARPWLATPVTSSQNKVRKGKAPPQVVNKIFFDCVELTDDPMWKNLFNQAAYGKLPRGFLYKESFLSHKKGNKTKRIEVPQAPAEAISACIEFFQDTGVGLDRCLVSGLQHLLLVGINPGTSSLSGERLSVCRHFVQRAALTLPSGAAATMTYRPDAFPEIPCPPTTSSAPAAPSSPVSCSRSP